jgi:hypothetical protein
MPCTVRDFVMFGYNYPSNFIERAFESQGDLMINHLKEKFESVYDRVGDRGAMNTFYSQLDTANQSILEDYIGNYYG